MLTLEYKLRGRPAQWAAVNEAIRTVQFIRNTCLRLWMDGRDGHHITANDLQRHCAVLAGRFSFVATLNSQARQQAADRAWAAISRFYANCKAKRPGKKGYPRFHRHCRSVEYKVTGWKLEPDGRHITFTDRHGIGRLRLVGPAGPAASRRSPSSRSNGCGSYAGRMATTSSSVCRPSGASPIRRRASASALMWGWRRS